jgi:hypothetical protein
MPHFIFCEYWGHRQFEKIAINVDNIAQFSPGPNNGTDVHFRDGSRHLIRMTYEEFTELLESVIRKQENP